MDNFAKYAIAATVITLSATSAASAGINLNGPDLDGTRISAQTEAFNPESVLGFFGNGGCQPWQCGVNGPDLDNTRVHMLVQSAKDEAVLTKEFQAGGSCEPWQCGVNGPDLDGVRVHLSLKSADEIGVPTKEYQGIGTCAPWECGVNGPDLSGTRAIVAAPKIFAGLPVNGPDLDSTRVKLRIQKTDPNAEPTKEFRAGSSCEPWQCGVNGPDLGGTRADAVAPKIFAGIPNGPDLAGTRVHMGSQKEGIKIETPIVKFTDLMVSSYR